MSKKPVTAEPLKVYFKFFSEILKKETTEELPATVLDKFSGFYVIDSIPEFVPEVASDDIVCARYNKAEKLLVFSHIIQHSGNSVIRVQLTDNKEDLKAIRNSFIEIGCFSEKIAQFQFSMEVPFDMEYIGIKAKLDELKDEKKIAYFVLWLSEKHAEAEIQED